MFGKENLVNEISKENNYEEKYFDTKFIDPEHEKKFRTIEAANKYPQILVAILTLVYWITLIYETQQNSTSFLIITIIVGIIDLILIYFIIIKDPNDFISIFCSYFKYLLNMIYNYSFILVISINFETDKEMKIIRNFYIQFILILMNNLFLLQYICFMFKVITYLGYFAVLIISGFTIFSLQKKFEYNGVTNYPIEYSKKCNSMNNYDTKMYDSIFSIGKNLYDDLKKENNKNHENIAANNFIDNIFKENALREKTLFDSEVYKIVSNSIENAKSKNLNLEFSVYTNNDYDYIQSILELVFSKTFEDSNAIYCYLKFYENLSKSIFINNLYPNYSIKIISKYNYSCFYVEYSACFVFILLFTLNTILQKIKRDLFKKNNEKEILLNYFEHLINNMQMQLVSYVGDKVLLCNKSFNSNVKAQGIGFNKKRNSIEPNQRNKTVNFINLNNISNKLDNSELPILKDNSFNQSNLFKKTEKNNEILDNLNNIKPLENNRKQKYSMKELNIKNLDEVEYRESRKRKSSHDLFANEDFYFKENLNKNVKESIFENEENDQYNKIDSKIISFLKMMILEEKSLEGKNSSSNNSSEKNIKSCLIDFKDKFDKSNELIKDAPINKSLYEIVELSKKKEQSISPNFQSMGLLGKNFSFDTKVSNVKLKRIKSLKINENFEFLGLYKLNNRYYKAFARKFFYGAEGNFIIDLLLDDVTEIKQAENMSIETKLKQKIFTKITHEFKTPLIIIKSLIESFNTASALNQREITKNITNLSDYISFLINDIIYYSNNESIKVRMHEINLKEIIEFSSGVTESLIAVMPGNKTNIKVSSVYEDEVKNYLIKSDTARLKQVLLNLISNSVKFTKTGEISIKAFVENNKVCISVKDTGIGFSEKCLENILEKNDKVISINSNIDNEMGTGIGIMVTKSILEKLGHELEISSKENKGSEFKILINSIERKEFVEIDETQETIKINVDNYPKLTKAISKYNNPQSNNKYLKSSSLNNEYNIKVNKIISILGENNYEPNKIKLLKPDNHRLGVSFAQILSQTINSNKSKSNKGNVYVGVSTVNSKKKSSSSYEKKEIEDKKSSNSNDTIKEANKNTNINLFNNNNDVSKDSNCSYLSDSTTQKYKINYSKSRKSRKSNNNKNLSLEESLNELKYTEEYNLHKKRKRTSDNIGSFNNKSFDNFKEILLDKVFQQIEIKNKHKRSIEIGKSNLININDCGGIKKNLNREFSKSKSNIRLSINNLNSTNSILNINKGDIKVENRKSHKFIKSKTIKELLKIRKSQTINPEKMRIIKENIHPDCMFNKNYIEEKYFDSKFNLQQNLNTNNKTKSFNLANLLSGNQINVNIENLSNINNISNSNNICLGLTCFNNAIIEDVEDKNIYIKVNELKNLIEVSEKDELEIASSNSLSLIDIPKKQSFKSNIFQASSVIEKKEILIVDDSEQIRKSLINLLNKNQLIKEKYAIKEGKDGVDILKHLVEDQYLGNKIDIIITDENMEYINGSNAIAILKSLESQKKVRRVFIVSLTAHDDETTQKSILSKGADMILGKPLSVTNIGLIIKKFDEFKNLNN